MGTKEKAAEKYCENSRCCVKCEKKAFIAGAEFMERNAIEAFTDFVKNYCHEAGHYDICEGADHYIRIFTKKVNGEVPINESKYE